MKIAVIGSQALNYHLGNQRTPKDLDLVGTYDDILKFIKTNYKVHALYPIAGGKKLVAKCEDIIIEAEIAWPGSLQEELLHMILAENDVYENGTYIASIDILYLLKMSHRFLKNSPHFKKTMSDIHLLRFHAAKIRAEHQDFYNRRTDATYTYAHPKLNQMKGEFFSNDGVNYIYDHDTIHESMKQMDKPAYTFFKDEQADVWCSKDLFFACDERIQLNAVLEETLVLALERSQVPHPTTDKDVSFLMSLQKVCSSITSGWFRTFAWDHYQQVEDMYHALPYNYVEKFWNDVKLGIVKELK